MAPLPHSWLEYFFHERVRVIEALCRGEKALKHFLIHFTRTTPVVIADGPAGLSGSVKMVGFVPKKQYIEELAEKAYRHAYIDRPGDMRRTACILLEELYRIDLIDPLLVGGLEMAYKHSWTSIKATKKATLLFYTPPDKSYEVRTTVEIHIEDNNPYKKYLNAIHDIFHYNGKTSNYPAYIFIKEIYDNSATRNGFGTKIYP